MEEEVIIENGDYKCSKCGTYTVEWDYDYDRPAWGYDEVGWNIYTCSKCGEECSIMASEDYTKPGETIYF